jgi:hypothetical protein
MDLTTRPQSTQESRVVLALTEHRQRDTTRGEITCVPASFDGLRCYWEHTGGASATRRTFSP